MRDKHIDKCDATGIIISMLSLLIALIVLFNKVGLPYVSTLIGEKVTCRYVFQESYNDYVYSNGTESMGKTYRIYFADSNGHTGYVKKDRGILNKERGKGYVGYLLFDKLRFIDYRNIQSATLVCGVFSVASLPIWLLSMILLIIYIKKHSGT